LTDSTYAMSIALTRGEMARSWLVEHYRRQGNPPMRTMIAVGITVVGAAMVRRSPAPIAWIALAWGLFLLLRPVLFAAFLYLTRGAAKPFVVTVDARGVNIAGPKGARLLPWKDVTAFGLGSDYLWYEIRRGPRATIPFRVMTDRDGLEALFRANVRRA
jgi:hypothetical protein